MRQKISCVDEVIRGRLNRILRDIATAHLDVLCTDIGEKPYVQVSGHHLSGRPYPLRKPSRDRPGASAHFKASPAFSYADRVELAKRRRIVELLNQFQPRKFVARFVVAPEIVTALGILLSQFTPLCAGVPTHARPGLA